jgi:hypothetical protein
MNVSPLRFMASTGAVSTTGIGKLLFLFGIDLLQSGMTLSEHIDALDQMVVTWSPLPQIRSQIAFIGREVAVLEAENLRLVAMDAALNQEMATVKQEIAKFKAANKPSSMEIINHCPMDPVDPIV